MSYDYSPFLRVLPDADTGHESVEDWYDNLGYSVSGEKGDVYHPLVPYEAALATASPRELVRAHFAEEWGMGASCRTGSWWHSYLSRGRP